MQYYNTDMELNNEKEDVGMFNGNESMFRSNIELL